MSDSATSTWSIAPSTKKFGTTNKALQERLNAVTIALMGNQPITQRTKNDDLEIKAWHVQFLAEGGYNYVWLVSYTTTYQDASGASVEKQQKVVFREPKKTASPCQMINEIAFLTFLAKNHPNIPVPRVYTYSLHQDGLNSPYIAMEFIEGQPLDTIWTTLSAKDKTAIIDKIADIIIQQSEIDLGAIGGLTLEHKLGPTVEGVKLFKGREKFNSPDCYDIGPYASTTAYAVACYDKEIYYYTHAADKDLDEDLYDEVPKEKFIAGLQSTRNKLAADPSPFLPQEPFALVHGDFCGRNMMVHNGQITAILDWEFAGSYPLSEVLGGVGIELFELEDDNLREHRQWSDRIRDDIVDKARARGWDEDKIDLLVGKGNDDLQLARREMIPMPESDSDTDTDEGDDRSDTGVSGIDEDLAKTSVAGA